MRPSSPLGWWRAALAVASGVAQPRADIDDSDLIVERQVRRSALAALARRAALPIAAAVGESMAVSWTGRASARWRAQPAAIRMRAVGCAVVVAGATVLALDAVNAGPPAPFLWIVPAIACMAGALVAVAPDAFARALAGRSA